MWGRWLSGALESAWMNPQLTAAAGKNHDANEEETEVHKIVKILALLRAKKVIENNEIRLTTRTTFVNVSQRFLKAQNMLLSVEGN
jgi:hypothetical protein